MIKFNEVTWYSKLAAVALFLIVVPALAFYIGTQYQLAQEANDVVLQDVIVQPKDTKDTEETNTEKKDVVAVAKEVLAALKNKNYVALEALTSSVGLTLNEVPTLDLSKVDVKKVDVSEIPKDTTVKLFGYTDGKGDPINLTTAEYIEKWIYNHDYLNAPEIAEDKNIDGGSNSVNTVIKDAAGRKVVGFHFKGFDSKYEGMDWTTMYLIFDIENGEYKLRAIAKNNWTI